jgi:hypothetical protein
MIRNKAKEILTIIPYLIKKWVIIVVQLYHQLNLFPQGLNKHLSACNKFSPSLSMHQIRDEIIPLL